MIRTCPDRGLCRLRADRRRPPRRPPPKATCGPLVRALWLVQRHGTAEAADPRHDLRDKRGSSRALGKSHVLTADGMKGLIDPATFARLKPVLITVSNLRRSSTWSPPMSPPAAAACCSRIAAHADYLTTTFDMIDEPHRAAGETLADWIVKSYKPGQPLHVTAVCTGNSRRSVLGATMGNIAAAYCGMPEVHFHSGGTAPTAFKPPHDPGPARDRCRGRADRGRGPPGRAADRQPDLPGPLGRVG